MTPRGYRRWIEGAVAGAERLCLPMPWERGARRARMRLRREAQAQAMKAQTERSRVAAG